MPFEPLRNVVDAVRALPPRASDPWATAKTAGLVRVREYRCTACEGDPPRAEQFDGASIAVVRSGVFGVRTDKHTQLLSAGFLLLGNAGQNYEASHDHGVGDVCLVFDFPGGVIDELAGSLRRGAATRRPFAVNVLPPHPRVDALRRLVEEEVALGEGAGGLEELGLSLAAHVVRMSDSGALRASSGAPDTRRGRDAILAAIARIEQSAAGELRLSELAASAGLSPFHFLRLFKRETGLTPHRFLVQTRIRHAVELLRETSRTVTEIAFEVGFGDLSNFINAFRREVGIPPRSYRTLGRSGGGSSAEIWPIR